MYSIDAYPVAVCDNIRISRSRLYQGESWRGKIPSKHRYFYGIKAHLMVSETGHIVEAFLTPGRFSDVRGLGGIGSISHSTALGTNPIKKSPNV